MDRIHHELGNGNQAADRGAAFREGQQLRGEECRALAGARGLVQYRLHRLVRIELHLGHLNVALDDGQEVVEVVRDAAGQHAERFELARTQQLLFDLFALRNLSPQLLGRLVQFGRALLDPNLQLLIQSLGMILGSLQIFHKIVVFKLQVQG